MRKVMTEGVEKEYLYVKARPILELETGDLCQVREFAKDSSR